MKKKRRNCIKCRKAIAPKRLAALPEATTCVDCAKQLAEQLDVRLKGSMIWDHKTAPVIEIQTSAKHQQFKRLGKHARTAKGQGVGTGTTWNNEEAPSGVVYLQGSRCHPERPRVTPDGRCRQCAAGWYHERRRK